MAKIDSKTKLKNIFALDPDHESWKGTEPINLDALQLAIRGYLQYHSMSRSDFRREFNVSNQDLNRILDRNELPFVGEKLQQVWKNVRMYKPQDLV